MTKTFVLRPNAVLSSADSTKRFGSNNIVVIPVAVLEELQQTKSLSIEKAEIRRNIMDYVRSFNYHELTTNGVRQSNGSILKIAKANCNIMSDFKFEINLTSYQRRTLEVCLELKQKGNFVVLVTDNPCLQIVAEELNIKAEHFKDETFPRIEEQYTGRLNLDINEKLFNQFYNQGYLEIKDITDFRAVNLIQNEFVLLKSVLMDENGKEKIHKAYGKVLNEKIIQISMHERNPYGIKPMNDGQRFLINALYDETPLTVVKGNAGTGKTFCTLAVALDELEVGKKYSRILVTRKTDFSAIGYLPGELDNKMSPYMAGIKDNLSILINGVKKNKKNSNTIEDGRYYFESGIIQIEAIDLLRGRSIVNTLFIIDETQNIEPDLIKTIVTRAARGSKFVFLGDPTQIDNTSLNERYNGLVYLSEKMKGSSYCTQVTLTDEESVRSDLARYAASHL